MKRVTRSHSILTRMASGWQRLGMPQADDGRSRAGTTLSEVLISLAVMSIGVVSLATLFPISVLRSFQANQLTNSANLRYNVEAMLSVRPELYAIGAPWEAAKSSPQYAPGDMVTPTELTSLKSPPVVFQCTNGGTSDSIEPNWNFNDLQTTSETNGVKWQAFRLQNYIIDPLGAWNVESTFRSTGSGNFFGNDGNIPPNPRAINGFGNTGVRVFGGIGANAANDMLAAEAATLPDSWVNQAESYSVTYTAGGTTCTLNDLQTDLTNTTPYDSTGGFTVSRIVFYDATGRFSDVRTITSIGGLSGMQQSVGWTLPSGVSNGLTITPVRARVETRERRFTWLLSVRRGSSGAAYMDVVVFFRRPFSGKDEQVYPATFSAVTDPGYDSQPGIAGYDDDQNGTTDDISELGALGSDDNARNWVVIQYNSALGKPAVKKGGFVTDADNLRWYRVLDVVEGDLLYASTPTGVMTKAGLNMASYTPDTLATGMTDAIYLKVENKILQSGPQPSAPGGTPTGGAIVMRGIVDVYPIRTHLTWED